MKQNLLFFSLIAMFIFAACDKQQMDNELIPGVQDEPALILPVETADHTLNITTNDGLTADFIIDNENGQVYESEDLALTNKSVNAVSYKWDFGNGDTSTAANPSYRYRVHGTYTVTLTTTDEMGNTRQTSHNIEVLCIFGGGDHDQ